MELLVLNVTKRSDGPVAVGTLYHQIGKTDEQDLCVTEFELNHRLVVKSLPPWSPSLEMRFILDEEAGGTRLQDEWQLNGGGSVLLNWLGARRIKAAVADNLTKLKQVLEEGEVILQDGRVATR